MKKVLAFLLLFVAGVALLRWIEKPEVGDPTLPPSEAPYPPERPEDAAEARPVDTTLPEPADSAIGFRGEVELGKRVTEGKNRGHKLYDLVAKDSRSLEDKVELFEITASIYDEDTSEEVLRLQAENGRGTLKRTEEGVLGGFQLGSEIELHGVEVTLLRDAPVVPLTLRTADLLGTLEGGHFQTDGRVEISGKGLEASGVGFEFQVDRGLLRFFREGSAEVEVEPGRRARLTCDDELAIASPPQQPRRISMDASGNASITLEGRESLALEAQHVRILGRPREGGSEPFGFDRIEAEDDVRLATPASAFFAQRAEIALQGSTTRFTATLHGEPNGYLAFEGSESPLTRDGGEASAPSTINFRGEGPLEVTRSDALDFSLPGRGELEWEGARLTATESITGRVGPVPEEALFVARGGVVIVRDEGTVETEEFRLRRERTAEGRGRLAASAAGPARFSGRVDPEYTFDLQTDDQIDVALDGKVWRVPRATGVRLSVVGPRSYTASADEVLEFSAEPWGLEASGSVVLEAAEGPLRGTLRGDRLVVRGPEHFIVEGTAEQRAHFRSDEAEVVALRVERSGELLIAEGVERATFVHEGEEYELACGRLLVSNERATDADGVLVETRRFTARDSVHASRNPVEPASQTDEDRIELDCDEFEGVSSRHEKDGEFLFSTSTLVATGRVTSRYESGEASYDLTSDRVQVDGALRTAEKLSSVRLLAQGNVAVENRGIPPMRGEGDELEVDELGRGRLIAFEDRRVVVEGYLPNSPHPFAGTCRWIQFSTSFFAAADPEIEIVWVDPAKEGGEGVHARVRSKKLEVDFAGVITAEGDVLVEDVGGGPKAWALNADRVRIEERDAAGSNPLYGVRAEGNVVLRYGPHMRAFGDELTGRAEQRTIRVIGSPARVTYQGWLWESDVIEYDLVVNLPSTGKVTVKPLPTGEQRK